MRKSNIQSWYVVGYLRSTPSDRSFVFPVVQNGERNDGMASYFLIGERLEFFEPTSDEAFIHVTPKEIPNTHRLEDALPLYGYEYSAGKVYFGDAFQISKKLIDLVSNNKNFKTSELNEISFFITELINNNIYSSKNKIFFESFATRSGNNTGILQNSFLQNKKIKVIAIGKPGIDLLASMRYENNENINLTYLPNDAQNLKQINLKDIKVLFVAGEIDNKNYYEKISHIKTICEINDILVIGLLSEKKDHKKTRFSYGKIFDSFIVFEESLLGNFSKLVVDKINSFNDLINENAYINIDYTDLSLVLKNSGKALIYTEYGKGLNRAEEAAKKIFSKIENDALNIRHAAGIIVVISASKNSLKLSESRKILSVINNKINEFSNVIFGSTFDEDLNELIKITLIASGIDRNKKYYTESTLDQNDFDKHSFYKNNYPIIQDLKIPDFLMDFDEDFYKIKR